LHADRINGETASGSENIVAFLPPFLSRGATPEISQTRSVWLSEEAGSVLKGRRTKFKFHIHRPLRTEFIWGAITSHDVAG
jgi:hypothetical protein